MNSQRALKSGETGQLKNVRFTSWFEFEGRNWQLINGCERPAKETVSIEWMARAENGEVQWINWNTEVTVM